jgi:hypothetical protein
MNALPGGSLSDRRIGLISERRHQFDLRRDEPDTGRHRESALTRLLPPFTAPALSDDWSGDRLSDLPFPIALAAVEHFAHPPTTQNRFDSDIEIGPTLRTRPVSICHFRL